MSETVTAPAPEQEAKPSSMSADQEVAAIAAMLEGTEIPAAEAQAGNAHSEGEDSEIAPETASEQEHEPSDEAEQPPIDAPSSWSKGDRELFSTLPRQAQETVARRERERDSATQRALQDAAQSKKASDAERDMAAKERAYLSQQIVPMLAETQQRLAADYSPDKLAELARTDPAGYVAKVAERDALIAKAQAAQQVADYQYRQTLQEQQSKLHEKLPEWRDAGRFAEANRALHVYGEKEGFTAQELESLTDHRAIVVLEKARRYDEMMAKGQQAVAAKATQPKAPNVIRSAQRTEPGTMNAGLRKAEDLRIARRGTEAEQLAVLTRFLQ